jgi:hypothetical protein
MADEISLTDRENFHGDHRRWIGESCRDNNDQGLTIKMTTEKNTIAEF